MVGNLSLNQVAEVVLRAGVKIVAYEVVNGWKPFPRKTRRTDNLIKKFP
jgi:hypothetical protein